MSYAFVQDVPATWDTYRDIAEALAPDGPDGLVVHAAGPTDEGFRMIEIWDSRELCDRFRDAHLSKILTSLTSGTRRQPTYRELRIAHLITGEPLFALRSTRPEMQSKLTTQRERGGTIWEPQPHEC